MTAHAVIGHNQPPEATPFEQSKEEIEGLFLEAKNWLDGTGVQSQTDADGVSKLLDMLRKATSTADDRRKVENEPFDQGKAEVQARYAPLIADTKTQKGMTALAIDTCKKALTPWLQKIDAEKCAIAEALRREADEKAAAAQAAIRAAREADLEERERAEAMLRDAKQAEATAGRAEKDKARATGGARAVTLRTSYEPVLQDAREAARHYWVARRSDLELLFMTLAREDIRAGKRNIPGFEIKEVQTPV